MGQSFSSPSPSTGPSRGLLRRPEPRSHGQSNQLGVEHGQEEGEQSLLVQNRSRSATDVLPRLSSMGTFRRHISSHTAPAARGTNTSERGTSSRDEMVLEREERPLVSMDDLRISDAPITDIRASPMPHRSSLWRFGSRHTRRYSSAEPTRDVDGPSDILIQQSQSDESPSVRRAASRRHRHSMLGSLPGVFSTSHQPSTRRIAPISRPIPISEDLTAHYDLIGNAREAPTPDTTNSTSQQGSTMESRQSRMARVRRSISGPLETVLGSVARPRMRDHPEYSSHRVSRIERPPTPGETEYLLPPINVTDPAINLNESTEDDRGAAENQRQLDTPSPESAERPRSWASRLAERTPLARREGRGLNLLRGRSSRLIRREDEAPLSRILQLAAAAIAAQLSGSADALANLESMGDDHFDGGLNNFVEELNTVSGAANNPASETTPGPTTTTGPLNFWRVFRFVSPSDEQSQRASETDNQDPRTVTLVVVGVRSVPSSSIQRGSGLETGLDTLFGGPSNRTGATNLFGNLNRARLGRRSSIANSTPFPQQYDSQRHQRVRLSNRPLSSSVVPSLSPQRDTPLDASNHSQTNSNHYDDYSPNAIDTPRPSSFGAARSFSRTESNLDNSRQRDLRIQSPTRFDDTASDSTVRQRRRSASDSARHRNLGSGAPRRNGTVDPDGGPVQGRSWLIYVVGTNLPEDHPAFTTPSLFTDNPSYEDMLLLSNILGPVKPPVASNDDIAASGGRYRLIVRDDNGFLRATSEEAIIEIIIAAGERCQICLEDYELEQEVRKLNKCAHVFHQECIDEWLTTGRNSCPLCRGEGVKEKEAAQNAPA